MGPITDLVRRGSLVRAAAISSFVVVAGLVALVQTAAWLLPSKVHLTLPPFFLTVILLSILAFFFTFPVMWTVRLFYRDDIAELERRVAERTAQLRAANRELEAFSYSVSHDLRAPLRHIDGFSKILSGDLGPDVSPEIKLSLDRIADAAKQMGGLIDDLLNMAQIGRQDVVRKNVDLGALLQSVIANLQMECQGRQIRWEVGQLPKLACDEGLTKLVFTNLLSNAVKYTRRVEIAVIEVGQTAQRGVIEFFVRDNGAGFDQKYANKLFGVFQRLHRADEFEGTGVGLATVHRIIEKHGGRISAEGKVNAGATFRFTLTPGPVD
jgi:light-regulated signal transduction histidine kinase (bacteriophytochrome)